MLVIACSLSAPVTPAESHGFCCILTIAEVLLHWTIIAMAGCEAFVLHGRVVLSICLGRHSVGRLPELVLYMQELLGRSTSRQSTGQTRQEREWRRRELPYLINICALVTAPHQTLRPRPLYDAHQARSQWARGDESAIFPSSPLLRSNASIDARPSPNVPFESYPKQA